MTKPAFKLPFKMTNRIRTALTLLCLVAAWIIATPSDSWRYRMTVTLTTPDGEKTGSAVREVTVLKGIGLTGLPPSIEVDGEAIAIEVAPHEYVFALLIDETHGQDYAGKVMLDAFPDKKKEGRANLSPEAYPMFVRFDSLVAPQSVARADVAVKDITIEITDAPVTWSLRKQLPWLPNYGYLRLDGDPFKKEKPEHPFANALHSHAFSTNAAHK